jgi:EAL domain-containing protein (putative c-di-GMP-specific phosphodiesterase class I)
VLSDSRFIEGFTIVALREHGLDQTSFVIEITEKESVPDHRLIESLVRHYAQQGFRIALDDLGAGYSSLVMLVLCVPHFLRLDREIVQGIDRGVYQQKLVRVLVAFSRSVEAKLVAEGIETRTEFDVLIRLGVRYGQGFFWERLALGRSSPTLASARSSPASPLASRRDRLAVPCTVS